MADGYHPDSEALLQELRQTEGQPGGRLKIFFGYAAGVGKTYAMLEAAHRAKAAGVDVVAGYIEPHTQPETRALLDGLELLPAKIIPYKGVELREFDLDAALERHPQLILVDELAHTNAGGSRHVKRYQDVQELLRAGVDVYTTVNVQHLESLNDKVAAITGVSVAERIPDSVFDSADQVELVDLEPADLLERLRAGKTRQAGQAKGNFFAGKNLASLREIALRRTADRLDAAPWSEGNEKPKAGEHILTCLSASPSNPKVIRTAARMARAFHGAFTALFVETPDYASMSEEDRRRISANVRLAEELGARITTTYGDDPAVQIAEYARISGISKVVLGRSPHRKGFRRTKNLVDRLNDLAPDLDIYIIPDQQGNSLTKHADHPRRSEERLSAGDLLKMLSVLAGCTLGGYFFAALGISDTNIILLYLLGVLGIAMVTTGRSYSLLSSLLSVLLFNFFFTEPYFTLRSDPSYIATFGIMFIVALLSSSLTIRVKTQAKMNADKAYRTAILLESSHKLQTADSAEAILTVTAQQLGHLLERDLVVYPTDGKGGLLPAVTFPFAEERDLSTLLTPDEEAVAEWVLKNNKHAGATTNTLPGAKCLYLSIRGTGGALAVVGIAVEGGHPLQSFEKNLMVALLDECALALEKELTMREKQQAEAQAGQEALRANLLRAISHDLRTPLTSISGNANILMERADQLEPEKRRSLCTAIYDDAMWLINLVENLLAITKIEDNHVNMNMEPELLEDIFSEALSHLDRNACKHHICKELADDMLMADMDARLMVQVVINIVNNAIKYTPEGSHITLSAKKAGQLVIVEIADDGPGVSAEARERLFDRFYTVGNERGDGRRGLGLGLSLCKSIITAHGGTIEAIKNEPQGTIFRFTLHASEVNAHE
ncbi:sensor histidine kinase KdpD [Oscillibacter valericigenes]|uniref:sensor histidine kinase n=1 Tax=Oscillibacter valericigenes TaxID=351091 RepID=UPI001F2ADDFD|nr:sensor histidine kinase KdpD [Oscillibacter valericigenes]MCF2663573.1 sensor histidine kinase KdpD [Oscillibacter valericigenes]